MELAPIPVDIQKETLLYVISNNGNCFLHGHMKCKKCLIFLSCFPKTILELTVREKDEAYGTAQERKQRALALFLKRYPKEELLNILL